MASTFENIMAVYKGRVPSEVVFQPRLKHWFDVNLASGSLPERYRGMHLDEIYSDLDITPREVWVPGGGYLGLKSVEGDDVEVWSREKGDLIFTELRTPRGTIGQVERLTEHGASKYNVEYFLKSLEDVEVYKHVLSERTYQWDQINFEWGAKRFGKILPLRIQLPRSPLMWLIVALMGFQRTVTMLWRHPREMEELMTLLEGDFYKMIEVCRGKPVAELSFGDNMHQDLCPPPYFRKYVASFYQRVNQRVHQMGMCTTSHWDGFVKQLLPLAGETGLDGLECVTPLPQGDVSLEEMKDGMKSMFLRDGIPAVMFCPWTSIDSLETHVKRLLVVFHPRIILGISDLLPANADIERVRFVNNIVKEFNDSL